MQKEEYRGRGGWRGGGRPPSKNPKNKLINIKVTEEEREKIRKLAKEKGVSMSSFILSSLGVRP